MTIGEDEWGILWDQPIQVHKTVKFGQDMVQLTRNLMKNLSTANKDYAKALNKINKDHVKELTKISPSDITVVKADIETLSYMEAMTKVLSLIEQIGFQYDIMAEGAMNEHKKLAEEQTVFDKEITKTWDDYTALEKNRVAEESHVIKKYAEYEAASNQVVKHDEIHKRTQQDQKATKEMETRAKLQYDQSQEACSMKEQEFAHAVTKNKALHEAFYYKDMPAKFLALQTINATQISAMQCSLQSLATSYLKELDPVLKQCWTDLDNAVVAINGQKDTVTLLNYADSGFAFPSELAFKQVDQTALSNFKYEDGRVLAHAGAKEVRKPKHLIRKLEVRKVEFSAKLKSTSDAEAGLQRMLEAKKETEAKAIAEKAKKSVIKTLKKELDEIMKQMRVEAEKVKAATESLANCNDMLSKYENLSKYQAELRAKQLRGESIQNHKSVYIPDEDCGVSWNEEFDAPPLPIDAQSMASADPQKDAQSMASADPQKDAAEVQAPASAYGTAIVLSDYNQTDPGSDITVVENEQVVLLSRDEAGDSWTMVQRQDGTEGYVPTSFLTYNS